MPDWLNDPAFYHNRGIGQMREWFEKGLALNGVPPGDVPVEVNI